MEPPPRSASSPVYSPAFWMAPRKESSASSRPESTSTRSPVAAITAPHRLLRVGDVPQGGGGEHPQVGQLQVVHEGAVALQSLTGHLDPLGGEGPVADVAGQAGHHLSVHEQADLPALALVDGQADGVGPHVRDSVDHNAVPSL